MTLIDKSVIYAQFESSANTRIRLIQDSLDELKEAGRNESKSTAGDKHETALAMIQLEQEKKRNQLFEAVQQLKELSKIDPLKSGTTIGRGSVVITDKSCFFLSQALGKIKLDGQVIVALSPQSPLGVQLMGRAAGEKIIVNSITYLIEFVY